MAVGKNKRLSKGGGKRGKGKKVVDPYSKKDWYEVKAPSVFSNRNICKTMVSRTAGTRIASEALKHRVFEINLADLNKDEDQGFRKMKLRIEDVAGKSCLTNFWGMDFTTDKLRSLVRKWQTLIEAHVDVKTLDGYYLRIFAIAFTNKRPNTQRKTAYAQTAQIRRIRAKMMAIMIKHATTVELKDLVAKFIPESIGKEITKACNGIYPLKDVFIRKVKMLKAPKFDPHKLAEVHGEAGKSEETGVPVETETKAE